MEKTPTPNEELDPDIEDPWTSRESPQSWIPLFHRIHGVAVVDLLDNTTYQGLPFHRWAILALLILAVKDRATAIYFSPGQSTEADDGSEPTLAMSYIVDGIAYDLIPPPIDEWAKMVEELEVMTGLTSVRHRLAASIHRIASRIDGQPRPHRKGRFLVCAGDETLEIEYVAFPSDHGEQAHLNLPPVSASLSDRVWAEMKRRYKTQETDTTEEVPVPHSGSDPESAIPVDPAKVAERRSVRKEPLVEIDLTSKGSKKAAPLARQLDGISVIDLVDNHDFPQWPAHRQVLFNLLMLTAKDRGSEFHFEPCSQLYVDHPAVPVLRLFYKFEGEFREIVTAPGELWPLMVREFETMTGLTSVRHRLAYRLHHLASMFDGQPRPRREGKFLLRADQEVIAVKLVAWPSSQGERIFLTFDPISMDFSERVRAAMWQLTTLAETETRSYLKRPATVPPTHPTGGPSDGETEVTDGTLESRIPADSEPQ